MNIDGMARGAMDRRTFITLASGLIFGAGEARGQRDLFGDRGLTVFESYTTKPVSYKLKDLMPVDGKKFGGILTIDYYVSPKPGTEFFRENIGDITARFGEFFAQQGVKTRIVRQQKPLSRHTSSSSIGIEFYNAEDFETRAKKLLKIDVSSDRYAGFYTAAYRVALLRAGKEFKDSKVTANRAIHEMLHGFGLLHPDSFAGVEIASGDNVMSARQIEEQTISDSLNEGQRGQLHSFLTGGNAYQAFKECYFDMPRLARKVKEVNGLEINSSSMNR